MTRTWLTEAVSAFGAACQAKLAGLLQAAGQSLKVPAVFHDEVRDSARQVRPDYGVSVAGPCASGWGETPQPI